MSLQLAVYVVIVDLPQVIGKPFVISCQETEKRGFPRALAAHKAEHKVKLGSRDKGPVDRPHEEEPEDLIRIVVRIRPEEVVQAVPDPLRPVPLLRIQVVLHRVVAVFMGDNRNGIPCLLFVGQPVGFLQVEEQVLHISVRHAASAPCDADVLYDVNTLRQKVLCNGPLKERVPLQHGQAVADAVFHTPFFGHVQQAADFFNAHVRLQRVHGAFRLPSYLRRQALPSFFQVIFNVFTARYR